MLAHLTGCPWANVTVDSRYPYLNEMGYHKDGQCIDQHRGWIHNCPWRTRKQLRDEVRAFFYLPHGIELWGWCAGYDWVAFCQLFGTMIDLPFGLPHYIRDFQYILDERGIADVDLPQQEEGLHHALADAHYLKQVWGYIVRNDAWQ